MPTKEQAGRALKKALEKAECKVKDLVYDDERTKDWFTDDKQVNALVWEFIAVVAWPKAEQVGMVDSHMARELNGLVGCDAKVKLVRRSSPEWSRGVQRLLKSHPSVQPSPERDALFPDDSLWPEPLDYCIRIFVAPPSEANIAIIAKRKFASYLARFDERASSTAYFTKGIKEYASEGKSAKEIVDQYTSPDRATFFDHTGSLMAPVFGLTLADIQRADPEGYAKAVAKTEEVIATKPRKPKLPSHTQAIEWINDACDVSDWKTVDSDPSEYTYDTETWFLKSGDGCDYYITAGGTIAEVGDFVMSDVEGSFEELCEHKYELEYEDPDMAEVEKLLPRAVKDYPPKAYDYMMFKVSPA